MRPANRRDSGSRLARFPFHDGCSLALMQSGYVLTVNMASQTSDSPSTVCNRDLSSLERLDGSGAKLRRMSRIIVPCSLSSVLSRDAKFQGHARIAHQTQGRAAARGDLPAALHGNGPTQLTGSGVGVVQSEGGDNAALPSLAQSSVYPQRPVCSSSILRL